MTPVHWTGFFMRFKIILLFCGMKNFINTKLITLALLVFAFTWSCDTNEVETLAQETTEGRPDSISYMWHNARFTISYDSASKYLNKIATRSGSNKTEYFNPWDTIVPGNPIDPACLGAWYLYKQVIPSPGDGFRTGWRQSRPYPQCGGFNTLDEAAIPIAISFGAVDRSVGFIKYWRGPAYKWDTTRGAWGPLINARMDDAVY